MNKSSLLHLEAPIFVLQNIQTLLLMPFSARAERERKPSRCLDSPDIFRETDWECVKWKCPCPESQPEPEPEPATDGATCACGVTTSNPRFIYFFKP